MSIKLRLYSEEGGLSTAFGPGTARLLQGIEQHSSLYQAAKDMDMAYSKAWKSIRSTEANLGYSLIFRNGSFGSTLTDEGKKILTLYEEVLKVCEAAGGETLKVFDFEVNP
jgi:molybdate transport system regulatory protein